jgi:hypothetical protein
MPVRRELAFSLASGNCSLYVLIAVRLLPAGAMV